MNPSRRDFLHLVASAASAAVLSGCGGGGSPTSFTSPTTATPNVTPAPSPAQAQLIELTAVQAIQLMRSGALSAVTYARALLDRASSLQGLSALISQDPEQVLLAAARADARLVQGIVPGPLHGLPLLIKDNINTVGLMTTAGTPSLRQNAPLRDAQIVTRLYQAGASLFGKANMHELAQGITSSNPAFGAVRNPYNPSMIPGGSSGGNAAAVGARFTPAGVGTDTGGSTRIPSALCGIVGMRPSVGRYPGTGPNPVDDVPISHTRDTPGPMARCMADVTLLDAVMAGVPEPWQYLQQLQQQVNPKTLRLGVAPYFFNNLDGELKAVVDRALSLLQASGITLVDVDIPDLARLVESTQAPVVVYETGVDLPYYLQQNQTGLTLAQVQAQAAGPDVKAILAFTRSGAVTQADYLAALQVQTPLLKQALNRALSGVDGLLFPTTVLPARPINPNPPTLSDTVELNGEQVNTGMIYSVNCEVGSCADLPGLSLPAGLTRSGLPVGLEIDCMNGLDSNVLAIGFALERILGFVPPPNL